MCHGRLRAIGSASIIKKRHGAGYRISIMTETYNIPDVHSDLSSIAPNAILETKSGCSLVYHILQEHSENIPEFVRYLEENSKNRIITWGISQTSLEQVFLRIVKQSQLTEMVQSDG